MSGFNNRALLLNGGSLLAVACAMQIAAPDLARAQAPAPSGAAAPASDGTVSEIVITGSRIQSGFVTPTPVTVSTASQLTQAAPRNLADGLVQLPAFNNNTRSENPGTAATGGASGQNLLNLRGLGANRNLILLDGRRMVATNSNGSVDVNMIPQKLVSRVDVVTGGASAAYGSDAVAGVVNFVLDTRLEGVKGEIQSGISTYGDLPSYGASLAVGHAFSDRARAIASVEWSKQKGVSAENLTGRDWFDVAKGRIPNPVRGALPRFLIIPDIRSATGTYGGLITSGPLNGTMFLPGGATATFNRGAITGTAFQSGGDGARANIGFSPDQMRAVGFLHAEYDLSPRATLFAEAEYAKSHVTSGNFINPQTGAGNQFTIFRENAYLPAAVQQRMVAANVTSFTMGRYEADFPTVEIETIMDLKRFALGFKGEVFGNWKWDTSYTYGQTDQEIRENNLVINRNLYSAADAVVNPANGQIVCRSTLSGLDAGCVPLNLFGQGSPSAAAVRYVTGDSVKYLTLKQHVAVINLSGDLGERLSFGAGPISLATGLEYRKEIADQTVDPLSPVVTDFTGVRGGPASQQGRPGSFNFFNPLPLAGSYDIKEGYAEIGVPVLKDKSFAKSLDVTGAVRRAVYSLAGGVTTWKAGFNYQIDDDVRVRLTRSRDIRGPNILELFNSATQNSNNQVFKGVSMPALTINSGNPNLGPETADTLTYGAVYRPSWFRGFQASLDYYKIAIEGAIGNIPNILLRCEQGSAIACAQVTFTPQNTLIIRSQVVNLNLVETRGFDMELAYSRPLWDGVFGARLLVNHSVLDSTTAPGDRAVSNLGTPSSPRYRGSLQIRYAKDNWTAFVQERYISKGRNSSIEIQGIDTGDNLVPTITYLDIGGTWSFGVAGHKQELFFNISNLLDQSPPTAVGNPTSFSQPTDTAYDRIGRYYSAGLRFKW